MKIQDLLTAVARRIESHSETPQLDAQVLLAHVAGKNRAWIAAHPEFELDKSQVEPALKRLEAGEPLPYILGKWEFFGLEFDLTPDVLIPRPETELLVEKALAWLHPSNSLRKEIFAPSAVEASPASPRVADIGAGSGAIAVAIAKHAPNARILASDISPAALEVAKRNAGKHRVQGQIEFVECDLLPTSNVERLTFNVLCSNPPYIPTQTLSGLPIFGREPALALDGGADGLTIYRRIFQLAPRWLAPQSMILLEIESTLGEAVTQLGRESFPAAQIQLHRDLAGLDRLVQINLIN
jgi:release factor glutamine methyltransferase